jgi:hypothetical protein
MLVHRMFTKRIILLIVGIVVAIAICFSTSLFGMKTAHAPRGSVQVLKPNPDFISVVDRNINWNAVIRKF